MPLYTILSQPVKDNSFDTFVTSLGQLVVEILHLVPRVTCIQMHTHTADATFNMDTYKVTWASRRAFQANPVLREWLLHNIVLGQHYNIKFSFKPSDTSIKSH